MVPTPLLLGCGASAGCGPDICFSTWGVEKHRRCGGIRKENHLRGQGWESASGVPCVPGLLGVASRRTTAPLGERLREELTGVGFLGKKQSRQRVLKVIWPQHLSLP